MKKLIPIFALCLLSFYSCKKEVEKTPKQPQKNSVPVINLSNSSTNVSGVAHYICPKKCKGGNSGSKGICKTCKTPLAHNQAFHNKPVNKPISTPINTPKTTPTSGPNLAGQYHYICNNGCTGVGDKAGKCNKCSKALVHNTAFHQ